VDFHSTPKKAVGTPARKPLTPLAHNTTPAKDSPKKIETRALTKKRKLYKRADRNQVVDKD
ncbi:hypothetical protein HK102_000624, partial [Quaeritorhiza haematococci]